MKFEEQIIKASQRIKNGEQINAVLLDFPAAEKEQAFAYLSVVRMFVSLPKKQAPVPAKRFLFSQVQQKVSRFASFIQSLKTPYAIAVAGFILLLTGTVSAAIRAVPGSSFFAIRKGIENVQLKFAVSPEAKLQLELQFANNRVEDAQKVLATSDKNAQQAALNELSQQTQTALNNIKAAALTPAVSKNPDILQKAEQLASAQIDVAAKVDPKTANSSEQQNKQALADIKKLVAAANEQISADLPPAKDDKNSDNSKDAGSTAAANTDTKDSKLNSKTETAEPKAEVKTAPAEPVVNIPVKPQDTYGGFIPEPPAPDSSGN